MNIELNIPFSIFERLRQRWGSIRPERAVAFVAVLLAVAATWYSYAQGYVIAYGDAESHLNIAKRVVDSLTPGLAQLGGIWLPLPHVLLAPFVLIDPLWRSGIAGSIISGLAFVVSAVYIYKLTFLLTKHVWAGVFASLVFMVNPNILYLQSTPMTELTLIVFFTLSSYYFLRFVRLRTDLSALLLAAFFGFCAALSRYDGWFLVCAEAGVLALLYFPWKRIPRSIGDIRRQFDIKRWRLLEGKLVLFSTLAFFGVGLWLLWGYLILGDPLYFTHSPFSAKSQQSNWLARGMLPAYHDLPLSFLYYFVTSMSNSGVLVFLLGIAGCLVLLADRKLRHRYLIAIVLLVPFIFNILTLFLGQSVIFIPSLTPETFEWRLFNVRYGVMMVPVVAVCAAYLFYRTKVLGRLLAGGLVAAQLLLFSVGYTDVISLRDGVNGLSSAKTPDAERWMADNYDDGLVLLDDYARTMSIIRSGLPMRNVIYIGNKPYWEESLVQPEKYAKWVVLQKDDAVWKSIIGDPLREGELYKYFEKAYTSPEILIFKRNPNVPAPEYAKNHPNE